MYPHNQILEQLGEEVSSRSIPGKNMSSISKIILWNQYEKDPQDYLLLDRMSLCDVLSILSTFLWNMFYKRFRLRRRFICTCNWCLPHFNRFAFISSSPKLFSLNDLCYFFPFKVPLFPFSFLNYLSIFLVQFLTFRVKLQRMFLCNFPSTLFILCKHILYCVLFH